MIGVANVLSTTVGMPRPRAAVAMASRSTRPEERIGGGLEVDEPGGGFDGRDEVGGGIAPRDPDAEGDQFAGDELERAAIEVALEHDVIAGNEVGKEESGDGSHAGAEDDGGLTAFEGRDFSGDDLLVGGIEVARIEILVGRVGKREGGGSEHRAAGAAGGGVQIGAGMDAQGRETAGRGGDVQMARVNRGNRAWQVCPVPRVIFH